jgi:phosphoserine phosphatase
MTSLTPTQAEFVESVLRLSPRVAAFDCDGTLWSGDAGEGFFSWELDQGLVSEEVRRWARPRYADYRAGKVPEEAMCGEMVTMHRGLREEIVQQAANAYFAQEVVAHIFPEMQALVQRLRATGCDVWAVSSTNLWVIRAAMPYFDFSQDCILAAEATVVNGTITDRLIRVPTGPAKPEAIRKAMPGAPDCAFGNSIWDREMLAMSQHAFAINANPDLKEIAMASSWRLYQPEPNHLGREA